MKEKKERFYINLLNKHDLLSSLSQFIYTIVFTTILTLIFIFSEQKILFLAEETALQIFIFIIAFVLMIERFDVLLSRFYGWGSFASYIYVVVWLFSLILTKTFMPPTFLIQLCVIFIFFPTIIKFYIEFCKKTKKLK